MEKRIFLAPHRYLLVRHLSIAPPHQSRLFDMFKLPLLPNQTPLSNYINRHIIMKYYILTIFLTLLLSQSYSQAKNNSNTYFKFSAGRVAFGTGDFFGNSLAIDVSKNVIKQSKWGLDKLLLGGEFLFENGTKNPVIQNPTADEFFSKTFHHTSNAIIWAKASYYPFKKFVRGFNIQVGPTYGYSYRSTERQARRVVDPLGNSVRQSILSFDNGFILGYRISTGIDFDVTPRIMAGFRLDFSNNTKGEINTLAGLRIGYKF